MKNLKRFSKKLSAILLTGTLVTSLASVSFANEDFHYVWDGTIPEWAHKDVEYIELMTIYYGFLGYDFSEPADRYDLLGLINQFTWKYIEQPLIVDDGTLAEKYGEDYEDICNTSMQTIFFEPVDAWYTSPLNLIEWGIVDLKEVDGKRKIEGFSPITKEETAKALGVLIELLKKEIDVDIYPIDLISEIADVDLIDKDNVPYVQDIIANKILNLDSENKFNPDKEITLQDFLVIMGRFKRQFDSALTAKGLPKSGLPIETYSIANPNAENIELHMSEDHKDLIGIEY